MSVGCRRANWLPRSAAVSGHHAALVVAQARHPTHRPHAHTHTHTPPGPLRAGRKKRKGASDSDSDGMEGGDDSSTQALAVAQPQQSLADLAQAFMQMLSTQDPRPKSRSGRGGRRDGAGGSRRTAGPIIEEAPSGGGGFASPIAMPGIPGAPGVLTDTGASAPGVIRSTPAARFSPLGMAPASGPFNGVAPPSAAAAAAFNAAAAGPGLPSFMPLGGDGAAPLPVPMLLPDDVALPQPATDNNPIVELPELDNMGLGSVDLVGGVIADWRHGIVVVGWWGGGAPTAARN